MLDFVLESGKSSHDLFPFRRFGFICAAQASAMDVVKGCCLEQSVEFCKKGSDTDYDLWPIVLCRSESEGCLV